MKFVGNASSAAMLLLIWSGVPLCAQPERQHEKESKTETHGEKREERKGKEGPSGADRQERSPQQDRKQDPRDQHGRPEQQKEQHKPAQQPQRDPQPHVQQLPQREQQTQQQPPMQQKRDEPRRTPQQPPLHSPQQAARWQQQRGWQNQGAWQGNQTWRQSRARQWEREHRNWAQRGGYGGSIIPQISFNQYFGAQHWFRIQSQPTMYMGYPRFGFRGFSFMMVDPWPEYWDENWYQNDDVYVDYEDGYYLYNRSHPGVRLAITLAM